MGKFEQVELDVYSIFASVDWTTENIKTYPTNMLQKDVGSERLVVTILPSGSALNLQSVSGIIIIDIYTAAGQGVRRAHILADKLDTFLVGKSLVSNKGTTLCKSSYLAHMGIPKDNPATFKSTYTINFNYFGVA